MPPELWLSTNANRVPTRVCVMSILIVAVRILYNINGTGKWEMTLSASSEESHTKDDAEPMSTTLNMDVKFINPDGTSVSVHIYESDCAELLRNLEKSYEDSSNKYDYCKDLPTYLQYCKDVVFAGLELVYNDPDLIEELWDFYQKNQEGVEESGFCMFKSAFREKRPRDSDEQFDTTKNHKVGKPTISLSANSSESMFQGNDPHCSDNSLSQSHHTSTSPEIYESSHDLKNSAIRYMKIDMEEQPILLHPT